MNRISGLVLRSEYRICYPTGSWISGQISGRMLILKSDRICIKSLVHICFRRNLFFHCKLRIRIRWIRRGKDLAVNYVKEISELWNFMWKFVQQILKWHFCSLFLPYFLNFVLLHAYSAHAIILFVFHQTEMNPFHHDAVWPVKIYIILSILKSSEGSLWKCLSFT